MTLGKYFSPLGEITIAVKDGCVAGLWFEGQKYYGSEIKADASYGEHSLIDKAKDWLKVFFSGKEPPFCLPLATPKTANIARVRKAMLAVPYGTTISYSELAEKAGLGSAVRAVAGIVARNPFIIIVPCHRIISKNGNLTGYAAGLERKEKLLEIERQSS